MTSIETGIHYYRSKRYDEAIQFFSSLLKNKEFLSDISNIHLWLGKCYFEKTENYTYSYRVMSSFGRGPYRVSAPSHFETGYSTRRMTKIALGYFNSAIKQNNLLAEAHYWKGKALQYEGEIDSAYKSYINAARLSEDSCFLAKCISLFASHENLSFLEVRDIDTISIETAIAALSSENAYTRMEGCLALSNQFDKGELAPQIVNQIRLRMSAVAGYKLFCSYIPFTGDGDSRIKTLARSIINKTKPSTENYCYCLFGNYQADHYNPMQRRMLMY